ncbi:MULTISPECIES: FAD-linked oxidase C-terminal domain-containing protein [unclassified Arcicella]|uniref:FAD-binding and (Fe-S)-binding domain-containing protein n=1 Tax=unclassified Arcicella TaxID=2644986 RepID=UPI00285ECED4|nr:MULTISPECIES: FAD-linked oxidase C-terminal domain-containing protein [unclassified Arcicella]MDR6561097.1 FAD/FMN-containing dehydrogenase/Fe-S oxidoreductase [Arcicella sp. BE51]MDR6810981.1 FAD/FMN-containing dehydrogenase/Fe-S oxidoreductase [Arcicella sp. BE140]MDR6822331.1 FAD/FMN-containing dehydrogenase/Fe-S oxidoreductase [Arcicella sp. BE139]
MTNPNILTQLASQLEGELYFDTVMRTLYATDASAYREMPQAVALPKTIEDIRKLINFARDNKTSIIPRTAGTSLAGQVVGNGIVVDVSKNFTKILEVNKDEHWVRVQPGVVRDVLNIELKKHGLFFGPETSTANRAMIGGMVGNNSCGSNSVVYGSTREHLMEVKAILADGTDVVFKSDSLNEFNALVKSARSKNGSATLLDKIYLKTNQVLSDEKNQAEIKNEFPKPTIERRNTGYALDMLLNCEPYTEGGKPFNFCELIAGSEGTLCFLTEIKLHVNDLPPKEIGLVCVHFNNVEESLRANLIALKYKPSASELIDHYILECTKASVEHSQNRFFVQGDPGALLVVELRSDNKEEIEQQAKAMEAEMRAAGLGYHFPVIYGEDTKKVWNLRKAGLGLLSNLPGDEKAVAVIEDTAVDVNDLPDFIREFNEILTANDMYSVHYAHAGSGEIHLRPIINLKTVEGNKQFRLIAEQIATLVKKYKGSLSGEHGDGRLRGEFIRQMVGEHNYELMKEVKRTWDPYNVFNPNKIVDTPPMDTFLRYTPGQQTPEFKTTFRFQDQNILQHAEQCNGSGDCRKTPASGGTMCPSYMATRNEKETTRARANILREFLTHSDKANRFNHEEIKEVFDLCLACKGCKGECPSNVDVAKLKMEFLHQYYKENGVPIRSRLVANFSSLSKVASYVPWAYNFIFDTPALRKIANTVVGFHPDRTMPLLANTTLKKWAEKNLTPPASSPSESGGNSSIKTPLSEGLKPVYLFIDEFTNYNDVEIGITAVKLLNRLGYEVIIPNHAESGRPQLSKGLLDDAKKLANKNVSLLKDVITAETPLIGIEPSAILTFRDEYPDLVNDDLVDSAKALAKNVFMIEEFLAKEIDAKRISKKVFTTEKRLIKLHGHCQQKALSSLVPAKKTLSLPENFEVQIIPSGCCGMAGSFGYEKEHFELSNQVGELVLFPTIRQQGEDVIIAASGTSCRHQIHDGTGRTAKHAVEILFEALV